MKQANDAKLGIKRLPSLITSKKYRSLTCETRWMVAVNMADSISLMKRDCTLKSVISRTISEQKNKNTKVVFFT